MNKINDLFDITGKVVVITGGAGFLGSKHCEVVAQYGGIPVIFDLDEKKIGDLKYKLNENFGTKAQGYICDITNKQQLIKVKDDLINKYNKIDILINNAAIDPKVTNDGGINLSRLENFSVDQWNIEISVGLTGALLCSQVFGSYMAGNNGGVILNISSDLGIIAPDQRLYRKQGIPESDQSVKPVTYSVIKHGLIGLTKYLATYWANKGVRANTLCPGGVVNNQSEEFVQNISNLIPMGRMAHPDELKGAVIFLISGASTYLNGATLIIDGGRTIW